MEKWVNSDTGEEHFIGEGIFENKIFYSDPPDAADLEVLTRGLDYEYEGPIGPYIVKHETEDLYKVYIAREDPFGEETEMVDTDYVDPWTAAHIIVAYCCGVESSKIETEKMFKEEIGIPMEKVEEFAKLFKKENPDEYYD